MNRLLLRIITLLLLSGISSCEKPGPVPDNSDVEQTPDDPTPVDPTPDDPTPVDPPVAPTADLLDIVFNLDGTAKDVSASSNYVQTLSGNALVTYQHPYFNSPVAHFSHEPGTTATSGYYRVDFTDKMAQGLADGHTLEMVFCSNFEPDGATEYKMFSAMDSGGTGFLISKSNHGTALHFLPNVSTDGSSKWIWTSTGIRPVPGRYYHVVGVWNKREGKSYVYVDGELKATVSAPGNFVQPSAAAAKWWSIGGDASKSGSQASWNGDVALARVYDDPLDASQVKLLYEKASLNNGSSYASIDVKDQVYLPYCDVTPGSKYTIWGVGFKQGDKVVFGEHELQTEVAGYSLTFTIPSGLVAGSYVLLLKRGDSYAPLGKTVFNVVSTLPSYSSKIVAHRGYWRSSSLPENSVASLAAAQKLGVWGSEFDIWITTDGRVVINHDKSYPTDASSRVIENSTYSDLSSIRLSNGEGAPTLESFLEQGKKNPEVKLVCEIKTHSNHQRTVDCFDAAMELVKAAGMSSQVVWIAFDYDLCSYIKRNYPTALVQLLCSKPENVHALDEILRDKIDGVDFSSAIFSSNIAQVRDYKAAGLSVNVWTIDFKDEQLLYYGAGADFVTTNYPEQALDLFSKTYISK